MAGRYFYLLECRDSQVLPVSLTLGVSFLQQAKHTRRVLDVTDEVVLTDLATLDFRLLSFLNCESPLHSH